MIVSAYDINDKLVEGKLSFTENGQRIVLTENGDVSLGKLHYVRFIEEETEIDKQVKSDIDVIKKDLEEKQPTEDELEKAGEERAKELSDAGMKEKEPDEYKTKFVLQASAIAGASDAGVDVTKADANNSEALKGLTESESNELENTKPTKTKGPYIDNDLEPLKQKLSTHSDDGWHDFCIAKVFDDLIKGNSEKLDFFDFWTWVADTGNKDLAELVSHDFDEGNLSKDSHTADFYKMYSDFKDQALSDPEGFKKEYGWVIKDNKNVPKTFKKEIMELEESEDVNNGTELHPDYQITEPYQDNLTRDQIYLKMKKEIADYGKENNNFDEKELVERMCNNLVGLNCVKFTTLRESFIKIRYLCTLREFTTTAFMDAVEKGNLKKVRNAFIKLHAQARSDGAPKDNYEPNNTLSFVDEVVTKLKEEDYSDAEIVEILGKWFAIGGTYEFDMDVINKIVEDRKEHGSVMDAHPDWFPKNEENVWNNGIDIEKEFS